MVEEPAAAPWPREVVEPATAPWPREEVSEPAGAAGQHGIIIMAQVNADDEPSALALFFRHMLLRR